MEQTKTSNGSAATKFQSLVGIRINWNHKDIYFRYLYVVFQSLVGIRINWNSQSEAFVSEREQFQSLVGIRINWNFV